MSLPDLTVLGVKESRYWFTFDKLVGQLRDELE